MKNFSALSIIFLLFGVLPHKSQVVVVVFCCFGLGSLLILCISGEFDASIASANGLNIFAQWVSVNVVQLEYC